MLQHDDIYPMHCVYVDSPGDTVHLQVPLGESVFCELLKFGYRINDMFVLVFLVNTSHFYLHCRYAPTMQSNFCRGNNTLQRTQADS